MMTTTKTGRAYEILSARRTPGQPRRIVASAPSFAEAMTLAGELFELLHIEADDEHAGCADFITRQGEVYCIEPEGFTLAGSAAA
jgi:hypothetical protein